LWFLIGWFPARVTGCSAPRSGASGWARRGKEVGVRGETMGGTLGLWGKGAPLVSPPPAGLP